LAQEQGTGGEQPYHDGRRFGRGVGEGRASGGGRHPGDIDIVLDGKRDAEERQSLDGTWIGRRLGIEFASAGLTALSLDCEIQIAGSSHSAIRASTRSASWA